MMNNNIKKLQRKIDIDLANIYNIGPKSLVKTFNYVMTGKGKRIRPLLTLLTSKSLFGNYKKSYNAALAIEILHNFTLVHDDIMDNDSIRHGKKTVHEKWDTSTAILLGDAMLAKSINILSESEYSQNLIKSFNKALLAVCEGQALDKEFENKQNINEEEYFNMIEKKTSHLIAMPIQIGALCYDCPIETSENLFKFGLSIGKAFQIQDDFLEIMSSPEIMKKSLDSDILLGKKTYPIILCKNIDKNFIDKVIKNKSTEKIIYEIRNFMIENKLDQEINNIINDLFAEGFNFISEIKFINKELHDFVNELKSRKS